ncbi:MAG: hypothetical protein R3A10_12675 [Caldilineaceae bacterium]
MWWQPGSGRWPCSTPTPRYLQHPHLADYAERLLGYFPAPLEVVFSSAVV